MKRLYNSELNQNSFLTNDFETYIIGRIFTHPYIQTLKQMLKCKKKSYDLSKLKQQRKKMKNLPNAS